MFKKKLKALSSHTPQIPSSEQSYSNLCEKHFTCDCDGLGNRRILDLEERLSVSSFLQR